MEELLLALNGATPYGVIMLLAMIVFHLVKGRGQMTTLTENHLHELPSMQKSLAKIEESSLRQETHLVEIVTVLRERKP